MSELEYAKNWEGWSSARAIIDNNPTFIDDFVEHGSIRIPNAIPEVGLEGLRAMCRRSFWRPLPVTRTIRDPDWHLVDKVTLFRYPEGILQKIHSMRWLAPELVCHATYADKLVRTIGNYLIGTVHDEAAQHLIRHSSNRAIINRMNGSEDHPAVLGAHQDPPRELGANVSFVLDDGVDILTDETVSGGTLNVYACTNIASLLGIESPLHGFTAKDTRYSVVFTNFTDQE